jgi:hypothetical protein
MSAKNKLWDDFLDFVWPEICRERGINPDTQPTHKDYYDWRDCKGEVDEHSPMFQEEEDENI